MTRADKEAIITLLRPRFPRVATGWGTDGVVVGWTLELGNGHRLYVCIDRSAGIERGAFHYRSTSLPGDYSGRGWRERLVRDVIEFSEMNG